MASAIIVSCHIKDSPDDRRLSLVRMIPTLKVRVISLLCYKPTTLTVDFQRAKRAIEALLVNKIGNHQAEEIWL